MTWVHGKEGDDIVFNPPLILVRQRWILEKLRKESVTSVLDIGCGEGNLLQALSFPAPTIPEPCIREDTCSSEEDEPEPPSLHLKKIAGLDISEQELNRASERIFPLIDDSSDSPIRKRWTDLEIKFFLGDLTVFDPELEGYEAIVASEVVEHLPQPMLSALGPVLLGKYKPRLLLITTPNFSFNVRFNRDGENKRGYPDPTGRTDRIFRHDDHQFEWTPEEFSSWATSLAHEYGYILEKSAIGSPTSPLPPPSESATYAVHCCVFRLDPTSPQHQSPPSSSSSSARPITPSCNKENHRLLRSTLIRATSLIGLGIDFEDIRETVRDLMSCWGRTVILVSELWPELGVLCGGSKRVLVQALGGWGNVPPPPPLPSPPLSSSTSTSVYSYSDGFFDFQEFSIKRAGYDLEIQWNHYHAYDLASSEQPPDGLIDFDSRDKKGKREENGWGSEESTPGWE
ncbi:Uncharacterized conserved protein HEN1/CORYMBOSA2 [Phaffia rhodozyma]|uniref:Small RNA 2'-O-methyltransferase n=1 Tax=Phaffia rhodozyma TaxID=264483 RepID=A0A0F7SEB9_PHARH|nr:Uncharacterized conserved protein HEN1/CORYMBOSA2 [Phaffia rhodozyma]